MAMMSIHSLTLAASDTLAGGASVSEAADALRTTALGNRAALSEADKWATTFALRTARLAAIELS